MYPKVEEEVKKNEESKRIEVGVVCAEEKPGATAGR